MTVTILLGMSLALAAVQGWPARTPPSGLLPERTLTCKLGRIANFDATKDQKPSDLKFEGSHDFSIVLPATPVRTSPPPESTDVPEPVDPRTRILADPDGLTKGVPRRFDRVVDYWPERVELTITIAEPTVNLLIIDAIDVEHGRANLFMTTATDAVTYDFDKMYAGTCKIG